MMIEHEFWLIEAARGDRTLKLEDGGVAEKMKTTLQSLADEVLDFYNRTMQRMEGLSKELLTWVARSSSILPRQTQDLKSGIIVDDPAMAIRKYLEYRLVHLLSSYNEIMHAWPVNMTKSQSRGIQQRIAGWKYMKESLYDLNQFLTRAWRNQEGDGGNGDGGNQGTGEDASVLLDKAEDGSLIITKEWLRFYGGWRNAILNAGTKLAYAAERIFDMSERNGWQLPDSGNSVVDIFVLGNIRAGMRAEDFPRFFYRNVVEKLADMLTAGRIAGTLTWDIDFNKTLETWRKAESNEEIIAGARALIKHFEDAYQVVQDYSPSFLRALNRIRKNTSTLGA